MFEKENNIASLVLNETSDSHDVENAMETKINVVESMDVFWWSYYKYEWNS